MRIAHDLVASDPDRFVLSSGHRVWEIRPRVSWHKGSAVNWVARALEDLRRRLVIYVGDDRTDEDAFASLPEGITVKVGDGPSSQAGFQLEDPAAVEQFLTWLVEKLAAGRRALTRAGTSALPIVVLPLRRGRDGLDGVPVLDEFAALDPREVVEGRGLASE